MNSNIHYNSKQYKDCAGKGCKHKGTTLLRINFLKKKGYFCDSCTADLLQSEIAVKERDELLRNVKSDSQYRGYKFNDDSLDDSDRYHCC